MKNAVILIIIFMFPFGVSAVTTPTGVTSPVTNSASDICDASSFIGGSVAKATAAKIKNTAGGIFGQEVPVKDSGVRTNTKSIDENIDLLRQKECIRDPLANDASQAAIADLTKSILDWATKGYEGGPFFVVNLQVYLSDVRAEAGKNFIASDSLDSLCTPFKDDIRSLLAREHQRSFREGFSEEIRCTLDDNGSGSAFNTLLNSGSNRENFSDTLFRSSIKSTNNWVGAWAKTLGRLDGVIEEDVYVKSEELRYSGGYFPKVKCEDDPDALGGEICNTVTPGIHIAGFTDKALFLGVEKELAGDEPGEDINSLLRNISVESLSNQDGLRGLSSKTSKSAQPFTINNGFGIIGSYLQVLTSRIDTNTVNNAKNVLLALLDSSIDLEIRYQDAVIDVLNTLNIVGDPVYVCYNTLQSNVNALSFSEQIAKYENELDSSDRTVNSLINVRSSVARAQSPNELNSAANAYDAVVATGVVHSASEINGLVKEVDDLKIVAADSTLLAQCSSTSN